MSVEAKWVKVSVFAIEIGRGQRSQVVVQRVIERPIECDDAGTIDPPAHHDHASPPTEQEPGPVEKAAAGGIVDPAWKRVEESWWVTPDYRDLADAAEWVSGVTNGWHDLVLGKPAEEVALGAGISAEPADVLELIAAKVKLPGDSLFKDARRILQLSGIVLGAMSGAVPFANACLSSLAHDLLAEVAAKAFRVAIGDVLTPGEVRPIPADQLGPDGARARQLHSDLVAAERQQREHEREMQVDDRDGGARARQLHSDIAAERQQWEHERRCLEDGDGLLAAEQERHDRLNADQDRSNSEDHRVDEDVDC